MIGEYLLYAAVVFGLWRRYRSLPLSRQMLLWAGSLPLMFFGYASTRSHGEANRPAFRRELLPVEQLHQLGSR